MSKLPKYVREALQGAVDDFTLKFGRPPGPDDPICFDPDSDIPVPLPEEKFKKLTLEAMQAAGSPPELVYAFEKTGLMLTRTTYRRAPGKVRREWDAAIAEYFEQREREKPVS
jgi:hypothetical protein